MGIYGICKRCGYETQDYNCSVCQSRMIEGLEEEVERLKEGRFTPEELQNLCHNLSETDRDAFFLGCREYQRKLFGTDSISLASSSRPGLFQIGDFLLHSGSRAKWKIECDSILPSEWEALALMVSERLPQFGEVEGVPRGGIPFANALRQYATPGHPTLLLAEDVTTTGASLERVKRGLSAEREVAGVVVFCRGKCPDWVVPLFDMRDMKRAVQDRDFEWWEALALVDNVAPTPEAVKDWILRSNAYFREEALREIKKERDLLRSAIDSLPQSYQDDITDFLANHLSSSSQEAE